MSEDTVVLDVHGDIAVVRLNRPSKFNALNRDLLESLHETMADLAVDDSVRAVVLTGQGRAFCAGGDLKAVDEIAPGEPGRPLYRLAGRFHEAVKEIRTMPKAVLGAINGPAAGGGFSLALACDLRVMSEDAYMMLAYVSNGLSVDGGGSFALPRLVGLSNAMELALLDEKVSATRALELGLTNRVVDADAFDDEVMAMAERLAALPTGSVGRTKRLFNMSFDNALEKQLEEERRHISEAGNSAEGREGIDAFLEKRKPDYRGES